MHTCEGCLAHKVYYSWEKVWCGSVKVANHSCGIGRDSSICKVHILDSEYLFNEIKRIKIEDLVEIINDIKENGLQGLFTQCDFDSLVKELADLTAPPAGSP